VTEPLTRSQLHQLAGNSRSQGTAHTGLEKALDALLDKQGLRRQSTSTDTQAPQPPEQSPIDRIRELFAQKLIPMVVAVGERYRPKGVIIKMDAKDLLAGGRGIRVEIAFNGHRSVLEGTILPEAIAFNETKTFSGRGGTVGSGPMLRGPRLNEQGFEEFLYDRIITLVRLADQSAT